LIGSGSGGHVLLQCAAASYASEDQKFRALVDYIEARAPQRSNVQRPFDLPILSKQSDCASNVEKGHVSKNCHMSSKLKCDKCPRQHATERHDVIVIELFPTKPKVMAESSPVAEESTVCVQVRKSVRIYGSCNGFQSRMLLDMVPTFR
ncbi:hypothetical protein DERF_005028, partial [Dermatophagoides farinae]